MLDKIGMEGYYILNTQSYYNRGERSEGSLNSALLIRGARKLLTPEVWVSLPSCILMTDIVL